MTSYVGGLQNILAELHILKLHFTWKVLIKTLGKCYKHM